MDKIKLSQHEVYITLQEHPNGYYTLDQVSVWIVAKYPELPVNRRHLAALLNMMGFGKVPLSYTEFDQRAGRLYHCRVHQD